MKILIGLFYFFCFFPYIKIFSKVDTQPTALLFGLVLSIFFLLKDKKIPYELFYFFIMSFFIIIFIDFSDLFTSLRGILNYWSLTILAYVTYKVYNKYYFEKFLKISINIWLITALIEKYYDIYFFKYLISDIRTSMTRGVTGLAPEPTFYGIMCVFFLILVLENIENSKKQKIYILNLLFQIFFLSRSSMTVLFLVIWLIVFIVKNINLKTILFSLVGVIFMHILIIEFMKETRLNYLYINFLNIKQIFYKDASLNERAAHIYYSLKGALNNYLIPNGFIQWKQYSLMESLNKNYFYRFGKNSTGRIMSGFGGIIYELGILGIGIIINYIYILYKGLEKKEISIFLLIILFAAIQISNPMIGVILGIALAKLKQKLFIKNNIKYGENINEKNFIIRSFSHRK